MNSVMPSRLRIGTRGSALARWQTDHVAGLLRAVHPEIAIETVVISTKGDRLIDQPLAVIGGKGAFTEALEQALRDGAIDCAVHSLKDLPTDAADGLIVGAIPERADPSDVLVSRAGFTLATLPPGASVGTSSRRRAAQLLHARPDLNIVDIRGNVDTRIGKAFDPNGGYDAIALALAGLERLGKANVISERMGFDVMLPAPGQGALGVQCRDDETRGMVALITDVPSATATRAERAFLAALGGGCSLPVAAYAEVEGGAIRLRGRVNAPDGTRQIDVERDGYPDDPEGLGRELARLALDAGAGDLLELES